MAPRPMKPNRRPEGERRILEGEEMELEKYEMKGGRGKKGYETKPNTSTNCERKEPSKGNTLRNPQIKLPKQNETT